MLKMPEIFKGRVQPKDPDMCWEWGGHFNKDGSVPRLWDGKTQEFVHVRRVIWEMAGKEFLEGRMLWASCGNIKCVNPGHMKIAGGSVMERLLHEVRVRDDGCWDYGGRIDEYGYGVIAVNRNNRRAHRTSYEIFVGPIPEGHLVCHKCDNPKCINPKHLFTGLPKANSEDMVSKWRQVYGEDSHFAKLTDEEVLSLRARHKIKKLRWVKEAARLGMCVDAVKRATLGITWRHLPC